MATFVAIITNAPSFAHGIDDTCGFVAVYQIIQKTGLYSLINQDLRTAIDKATAAGTFEVAGEPFSPSEGIFPFYLLEAIFEASPSVHVQLVQMQLPSMTDLGAKKQDDVDYFVDAQNELAHGERSNAVD